MENHDDDIVELGCASEETKGWIVGVCPEQSILPWRMANQTTGQCPKP